MYYTFLLKKHSFFKFTIVSAIISDSTSFKNWHIIFE